MNDPAMETTTIKVSTEAYNFAASYARSHNTSVSKMVESYLLTLMAVGQRGLTHEKVEKVSWREMEIPEEVKQMALPPIPNFPDDDKKMMETILWEKYESLS